MGENVPYLNPFYIFEQIYLLLKAIESYLELLIVFPWGQALIVLNLFSLVAGLLFVFVIYKSRGVRDKVRDEFLAKFETAKDLESEKSDIWQDILDHVESDNESQWKLAVIDADKILEEALRVGGYDGESIGDRLKTAESMGGFTALQDAWDAHKVRNRIAHESGFQLTKREARRAVELYKSALSSLHFL